MMPGSHVCGPHNPLRLLLPLVHPQHPPNHSDNVTNLMQFFAGDSILNTVSLQVYILALYLAQIAPFMGTSYIAHFMEINIADIDKH